jgi:hypothetical protein
MSKSFANNCPANFPNDCSTVANAQSNSCCAPYTVCGQLYNSVCGYGYCCEVHVLIASAPKANQVVYIGEELHVDFSMVRVPYVDIILASRTYRPRTLALAAMTSTVLLTGDFQYRQVVPADVPEGDDYWISIISSSQPSLQVATPGGRGEYFSIHRKRTITRSHAVGAEDASSNRCSLACCH